MFFEWDIKIVIFHLQIFFLNLALFLNLIPPKIKSLSNLILPPSARIFVSLSSRNDLTNGKDVYKVADIKYSHFPFTDFFLKSRTFSQFNSPQNKIFVKFNTSSFRSYFCV